MPWVNKIFFVTRGHIPDFLNLDNPKIRIVKHEEFVPEDCLPVFSINPIELNIHRIKDLSENYIYFNDDVYPLLPIEEGYYFQNNMVCDEAVESPIMPVDIGVISAWSCWMKANNILVINRVFNKRIVQDKNRDKWFNDAYGELLERNERLSYWNNFCGFHDPHMANAFHKSTLAEIWSEEPEVLSRTTHSRFRSETDVNQYLVRYWQLCKGDFVPRRTLGKSHLVTADNYLNIADDIRNQRYQMISLNEDCSAEELLKIKEVLGQAFEFILPDKSVFEL